MCSSDLGLGALRCLLGLESAIILREFLDSRVFGSAELCRAWVWTLFEVPGLGWAAFPWVARYLGEIFPGYGLGFGPAWVRVWV